MSKFKEMIISTNKSLEKRAEILESSAKISFEKEINDLKQQLNQTKLEIEVMLDFSPESTTSLKPNTNVSDLSKWSKNLIDKDLLIEVLNKKIETAEKRYKDLF